MEEEPVVGQRPAGPGARPALLTSSPEGVCAYVDADVRDPDTILAAAATTLDFTEWVALTMLGILGNVVDYERARAIVRRLVDAVPAGSYLVVNDGTNLIQVRTRDEATQISIDAGVPYIARSPDQIAGFFDGLDLLEPGRRLHLTLAPGLRCAAGRGGRVLRRRPQTGARQPVAKPAVNHRTGPLAPGRNRGMSVGVDDLERFLDQTNRARVPQFHAGRDRTPVVLSGWAPPVDQVMAVVDRTATAGFCYLDAGRPATGQDLPALADLLALDDPVAAPLRRPIGTPVPEPREPSSAVGEPWFQNWHADTLPEIADVGTSMLLCVHSGPTEGPLQLFNVTAAFVEVARRDPAAAAALMPAPAPAPVDVRRRRDPAGRPPFAVADGHLLAGSPADTQRWAGRCADLPAARRGLALLAQLAVPGSPYHLVLPVSAGQGVVLSAARIWYAEPATTRRIMLHGLFRSDLVIAGR
jgi:hypothetical protein